MIGDPGASVPDVSVDLGVADIFIKDNAQSISYTGKGEQTNVGELVDSTTSGMTIGGDGINRPSMTDYKPPSSVSRPHITKTSEEPVRGGGVREVRSEKDRVYIKERTEDLLAGVEPEPPVLSVTDKTGETDDFDYPALDELGALGTFGDEDPNWLRQNNTKKPVNRVRHKRTQPRRGRDNPPTTVMGMRI